MNAFSGSCLHQNMRVRDPALIKFLKGTVCMSRLSFTLLLTVLQNPPLKIRLAPLRYNSHLCIRNFIHFTLPHCVPKKLKSRV